MQDKQKTKKILQGRRINRVRAKVSGTADKPRLAIFKSVKHLSLQAIDDVAGKTLASATDIEVKAKSKPSTNLVLGKQAAAKLIGELIAKKLAEQKITTVVFDKRHHRYHGLVKSAADGAREGGLKF